MSLYLLLRDEVLTNDLSVAISSTTSQDKIAELFNLGVADVVLKPIQQQVARTLFLVRRTTHLSITINSSLQDSDSEAALSFML